MKDTRKNNINKYNYSISFSYRTHEEYMNIRVGFFIDNINHIELVYIIY